MQLEAQLIYKAQFSQQQNLCAVNGGTLEIVLNLTTKVVREF